MTTLTMPHHSQEDASDELIRTTVTGMIDSLMASLPEPKTLTSEEKRGIIARYTAVLEGNFIYWMTATLLAVKAEDARPILLDNLFEEVRDAHPAMLRRFAIAANAFPGEADAMAVNKEMNDMRVFLGKLSPVQSLASMAFFEGYIQKFMPYLAELATERGSSDMEYRRARRVRHRPHRWTVQRALHRVGDEPAWSRSGSARGSESSRYADAPGRFLQKLTTPSTG